MQAEQLEFYLFLAGTDFFFKGVALQFWDPRDLLSKWNQKLNLPGYETNSLAHSSAKVKTPPLYILMVLCQIRTRGMLLHLLCNFNLITSVGILSLFLECSVLISKFAKQW